MVSPAPAKCCRPPGRWRCRSTRCCAQPAGISWGRRAWARTMPTPWWMRLADATMSRTCLSSTAVFWSRAQRSTPRRRSKPWHYTSLTISSKTPATYGDETVHDRHAEQGGAMAEASTETLTFFTAAQRELFVRALNCVIPAAGTFPGAGDLGVASYLDRVVGQSAALKRLFARGLVQITLTSQAQYAQPFTALLEGQRDAVLRHIEATAPEFFEALVTY